MRQNQYIRLKCEQGIKKAQLLFITSAEKLQAPSCIRSSWSKEVFSAQMNSVDVLSWKLRFHQSILVNFSPDCYLYSGVCLWNMLQDVIHQLAVLTATGSRDNSWSSKPFLSNVIRGKQNLFQPSPFKSFEGEKLFSNTCYCMWVVL